MYKLEKTFRVAAAHQLWDTKTLVTKKCADSIHGHEWNIKITIWVDYLIDDMVIDFGRLKELIYQLDHRNINDVISINPTAENISKWVYDRIAFELLKNDRRFKLKVSVEESPGAIIIYSETKPPIL